MSNYVLTAGTSDLNYQKHTYGGETISRLVDFSKFTGTAAGAASDTADIITLPAGFIVESVWAKVITASSTASSTFGLGDSSNSVGYLANTTDATQAAGTIIPSTGAYLLASFATTPAVTGVLSQGKVYSTAGTLRVVLGTTAPLNGKVQFVVRGFFLPAV